MGILRRPANLIPLVALGLVAAWAVASLWWPFCYDQAIFGWVGDVMVHGGMPYRDAWDLKGPAAYLQYAGIEALFGKSMWSVRLVDILLLIAGLWGVAKVAVRLGGREAGLWAVAFAGLIYAGSGYGDVSQPDGWAAMLTAVALGLAVWRVRPAWARAAAAGLLMGWVALYKPLFVLLAPLPMIAFDLGGAEPGRRRWAGVLAAYLGAYGALVAAVLGWLAVRGALSQMLEILLVFNRAVYWASRPGSLSDTMATVGHFLLPLAVMVFLAVYGLARCFETGRRRVTAAVTLWALIGLGLVVVQGRFYPYQWDPFFFALATAAAAGLGLLLDPSAAGVSRASTPTIRLPLWLVYLAGAAALMAPVRYAAPAVGVWAESAVGSVPWRSYYARFAPIDQPELRYLDQREVADYLRARAKPGDSVCVWGFGPLILYLSGLPSASRFAFPQALITTRHTSPHLWREYSDELMRALRRRQPAFLVVGNHDATLATPYTSKGFLPSFPALDHLIRDDYALATTIGTFEIYRKRSGRPRLAPGRAGPSPPGQASRAGGPGPGRSGAGRAES